jgi:hypothetical protein
MSSPNDRIPKKAKPPLTSPLGTKLLHFTLLYSYFTCLTPNFGRDVCRHVR